ncbi:LysR substrate-binding domain-containing protein [Trinickia symbiotica]|uniref:LysR substrate-binding domain-containing protein n=1 Tax=Trinickia symbiotica TaxID=863227 RepID=UPI002D21B721|nr:LysR substrate-binding domain-containing protein [Trinickia symbiotica]
MGLGWAYHRAKGPSVHQRLSSLVRACVRALANDVLTELPPFLAAAPIQEKRLVQLLPQFPLPEQPINLLYPSHRHPSTIVRTYLTFCQNHVPKILHACDIGRRP